MTRTQKNLHKNLSGDPPKSRGGKESYSPNLERSIVEYVTLEYSTESYVNGLS